MPRTTISSREFNFDVSRAKRATRNGPVFITDRGKPAHVLLSFDDFQRMAGQQRNLVDALARRGLSDIEFDPPRARIKGRRVDLS